MLAKMRSSLAFLSLVTVVTFSQVESAPTSQCCASLRETYPDSVVSRNASTYNYRNRDFWSATEYLSPECVFLPDSAEKVSGGVSLFVEGECQFSIKGAGHSAIPGAANIHNGILLSTEHINDTNISFDRGYVRVGAGKTLGSVYEELDPHNLSAVIGRYEKVGLGLAVGAGFSFFSNSEGLTVDNVLNYEVVLANGTITNANATSNPDLFWALKGGNNNFGVVTHYHLATLETEGRVFGGIVYYPESSLDELADVIYDNHVRQAVEDPTTHTLPQYGFNGTTNETISFTPVVYNADVHELPEILQGWNSTPHYQSTLSNRNYSDLAVELNDGFGDGFYQEQRILTVYADEQLYKDLWWNFRLWTQNYTDVEDFYGLHCNMPITPRQVEQGVMKGGNALGLDEGGDTTFGIIYFGVSVKKESDASRVFAEHAEFVESMQELADQRGLLYPYLMLTYSGWDQPVLESYGEDNIARLREVQAAYDPTHVFQRLVPGGQKLPEAN